MPASFSAGTQAIPDEEVDDELDDEDELDDDDDEDEDELDDDEDDEPDEEDEVVDGFVSPQPATKTIPAPSVATMAGRLDRLR